MLTPANEQITVSPSMHSIGVSRSVTTPSYAFPNESIFDYQKPFLSAGLRGLHGCGICGGLGGMSTPMMLGLAAMAVVFLLPPSYRKL